MGRQHRKSRSRGKEKGGRAAIEGSYETRGIREIQKKATLNPCSNRQKGLELMKTYKREEWGQRVREMAGEVLSAEAEDLTSHQTE